MSIANSSNFFVDINIAFSRFSQKQVITGENIVYITVTLPSDHSHNIATSENIVYITVTLPSNVSHNFTTGENILYLTVTPP